MKKKLMILTTILAAVLVSVSVPSWAATEFSASVQINSSADFYQPLAPMGTWVEVGTYGRCWHPAHVDVEWRPYCEGHWEATDVGWYWISDEPWGWACYHYGTWVDDPNYGWCWVPGTVWAPAWVSWRVSDGYIGWAPCMPGLVVAPAPLFVFVDVHHFHDHIGFHSVIVNDVRIINRTKVINHFDREDRDFGGVRSRIAVNKGPSVDFVAHASGTRFNPRPVDQVIRETPGRGEFRERENQPQFRENREPQRMEERQAPQPQYRREEPRHEERPLEERRGNADPKFQQSTPPAPSERTEPRREQQRISPEAPSRDQAPLRPTQPPVQERPPQQPSRVVPSTPGMPPGQQVAPGHEQHSQPERDRDRDKNQQ